jgi:hypothetical protein
LSDSERRPAPVSSANATKAANAQRVADWVDEERSRRLTPPRMVPADKPHLFTNDTGDGCDWQRLLETFAVADMAAAEWLMQSLLATEDSSAAKGDVKPSNGLLALIHALEPRDAAETMLCCQMALTHAQTMDCHRRARMPGQTFEGRDINLRHAERFTRIYAQQLDALNKHRGKGQQKVTVEHVTVNEGGQAVVGSVSTT